MIVACRLFSLVENHGRNSEMKSTIAAMKRYSTRWLRSMKL